MDQKERNSDVVKKCLYCRNYFSSSLTRNRHIRKFHQEEASLKTSEDNRKHHIKCPLCDTFNLPTLTGLGKHIKKEHGIDLVNEEVKFKNNKEYMEWATLSAKIEVSYALRRTRKSKTHLELHYACNRSNEIGYQPNYQKRTEKADGSIKINGICPSRYIVRKFVDGSVTVNFQATHVGHEEKFKTHHLSTTEKEEIVERLKMGVTKDRILEDAKKKAGRMSLLKRTDLNYFHRKHIRHRKHTNEMKAVSLKVKECNFGGKKYAFLNKQVDFIHLTMEGTNSALDEATAAISETSEIRKQHDIKFAEFKKEEKENADMENNLESKKLMELKSLTDYMTNLDEQTYRRLFNRIMDVIKEEDNRGANPNKKRKMDRQNYYPA